MSRIGKSPISIPKDVTLTSDESVIRIKGPKGELTIHKQVGIAIESSKDTVTLLQNKSGKPSHAAHGSMRSSIANAIKGVTLGWTRELEIIGVGYRARVQGNSLEIIVGYSHPVIIEPPKGVTFQVQKDRIIVSGIDKNVVGQMAANIRAVRKPEPYKGKGIKYIEEKVRKKAGKAAKAVGGVGTGK